MSDLFPERRGSAGVGDDLGRVYTPTWLAEALMAEIYPLPPGGTIVEPSVGGGAFIRALLSRGHANVTVGVDIDHLAEGLALVDKAMIGDWPRVARSGQIDRRPALVIGNPPFGRAVGIRVTIDHVLAVLELDPGQALLVLPAAYICGSEFDRVFAARRPSRVLRVTRRPWPDRLREVAVFEWSASHTGSTTLGDLCL